MKIAILADCLELGGVETHIISLVNGFLNLGHKVLLSSATAASDLLAQIKIKEIVDDKEEPNQRPKWA